MTVHAAVRPAPAGTGTPRATLSRALTVPMVIGVVGVLPLLVASRPGPGVHDTVFWLQLALCCYAGSRLCAMVLTARRRLVQGSVLAVRVHRDGRGPARAGRDRRRRRPRWSAPARTRRSAVTLVLAAVSPSTSGALLARHRRRARRTPPRPAARLGVAARLWLLIALAYLGSAPVHRQARRPRGLLHQQAGHQRVGAGQRARPAAAATAMSARLSSAASARYRRCWRCCSSSAGWSPRASPAASRRRSPRSLGVAGRSTDRQQPDLQPALLVPDGGLRAAVHRLPAQPGDVPRGAGHWAWSRRCCSSRSSTASATTPAATTRCRPPRCWSR